MWDYLAVATPCIWYCGSSLVVVVAYYGTTWIPRTVTDWLDHVNEVRLPCFHDVHLP
jgi:hypothetical protein